MDVLEVSNEWVVSQGRIWSVTFTRPSDATDTGLYTIDDPIITWRTRFFLFLDFHHHSPADFSIRTSGAKTGSSVTGDSRPDISGSTGPRPPYRLSLSSLTFGRGGERSTHKNPLNDLEGFGSKGKDSLTRYYMRDTSLLITYVSWIVHVSLTSYLSRLWYHCDVITLVRLSLDSPLTSLPLRIFSFNFLIMSLLCTPGNTLKNETERSFEP